MSRARSGAKMEPPRKATSSRKAQTEKGASRTATSNKSAAKIASSSRKPALKTAIKNAPIKSQPKARVVNVRHTDQYDVYVGRRNPSYGLLQSPFANPYKGPGALQRYIDWFPTQPGYAERVIKELKGKVLACWCRPVDGFKGELMCHAQLLASLANDCYIDEID